MYHTSRHQAFMPHEKVQGVFHYCLTCDDLKKNLATDNLLILNIYTEIAKKTVSNKFSAFVYFMFSRQL